MILRKPYAFLIKHFKLIHVILAFLACYLIYQTKVNLDFFNEHLSNMVSVIGQDLSTTLIPWFYSITPIIIIGLNLVLLIVMAIKKKPYMFYVFNILIYIFVIIVMGISNSTLETMSRNLVDSRTIRLIRDFITLSFMAQVISIPFIVVRAVGFDIKKFDFKRDLEELEIDEKDREEFEVQINFDKNQYLRKFRRAIRFLKYSYKENSIIYNSVLGVVALASVLFVYLNFFASAPTVKYNTVFSGNGFSLSIVDSYLANTDYQGNVIDNDYYFLLVKLNIRSNTGSTLDTATTKLVIGNYYYFPVMDYRESFFDIGNVYYNEKIGSDFENKILLYKIPKELSDKKMVFSYINKNSFTDKEGFKSTNVNIVYKDLTKVNSSKKIMLTDYLDLNDTVLPGLKLRIYRYDIKDKFKISYNYCFGTECIMSYEYLTPNLNTNYDKVLLMLNGRLEYENTIPGIYDLYDFIEKFGKIRYNVDGVTKTQNIKLQQVVSKKTNKSESFYIEVPKSIEKSTSISFIFTVRNKIYEYVLK